MKVKSESEVAQSCPTLRNPMDCSLPGSSVHGIFQARVLEWGAIAFSIKALYMCDSTQLELRCVPEDVKGNLCLIKITHPRILLYQNLPAMQETWVQSLGLEDPLEKGKATHSSIRLENSMDRGAWWAAVHGLQSRM